MTRDCKHVRPVREKMTFGGYFCFLLILMMSTKMIRVQATTTTSGKESQVTVDDATHGLPEEEEGRVLLVRSQSYVKTTAPPLFHYSCFFVSEKGPVQSPKWTNAPHERCEQAYLLSLSCRDNNESALPSSCRNHSTKSANFACQNFPAFTQLPLLAPCWMTIVPEKEHEEVQHDNTENSGTNQIDSQTWKHAMWNETTQMWQELDPRETMSHWGTQSPNQDLANPASRPFRFSSVLSQGGGMHPRLHHSLELSFSSLPPSTSEQLSFSVDVWIHIPNGLFINVEEAYQITSIQPAVMKQDSKTSPIQNQDIQSELLVDPDTIIDQEEPAFASPSHAVLYRIHGPAWKSNLAVEWDTLLHVRYPTPSHEHGNQWIHMLAPEIVSFTWNDQRLFWNDNGGLHLPLQPPISFPVSTGYARDLLPVLSITMVVALLGTWLLLRDLRHASQSV